MNRHLWLVGPEAMVGIALFLWLLSKTPASIVIMMTGHGWLAPLHGSN